MLATHYQKMQVIPVLLIPTFHILFSALAILSFIHIHCLIVLCSCFTVLNDIYDSHRRGMSHPASSPHGAAASTFAYSAGLTHPAAFTIGGTPVRMPSASSLVHSSSKKLYLL
jgi:hypothetical protein